MNHIKWLKEFYKIFYSFALLLYKYQIKIYIKIYNLKSLLKKTKIVCIAIEKFFLLITHETRVFFLAENAENIDKS